MLLASGNEYVLKEFIVSVVEILPVRNEFLLKICNDIGELKVRLTSDLFDKCAPPCLHLWIGSKVVPEEHRVRVIGGMPILKSLNDGFLKNISVQFPRAQNQV